MNTSFAKCNCDPSDGLLSRSLAQLHNLAHVSSCSRNPLVKLLYSPCLAQPQLNEISSVLAFTRASELSVSSPSRESVSGVHFLHSRGKPFALYKPMGEEFGASKGLLSEEEISLVLGRNSDSFVPGSGAAREVAAYLLDSMYNGIAAVPETGFAEVDMESLGGRGHDVGSLQVFIDNVGDVDDFGPSVFDMNDIQKIAAFDIRVVNCDRHGGNILVQLNKEKSNSKYKLRPIDHGYILPDKIHSATWPVWMDWPAAKQPISPEVVAYIQSIDVEKEKRLLSGLLDDSALATLELATKLLKNGLEKNLTLYDIGLKVFSRDPDHEISYLEKISPTLRSHPSPCNLSDFIEAMDLCDDLNLIKDTTCKNFTRSNETLSDEKFEFDDCYTMAEDMQNRDNDISDNIYNENFLLFAI